MQLWDISKLRSLMIFLIGVLIPLSANTAVQFDYDGDGKGDIIYRGDDDLKWRIDLMDGATVRESLEVSGMSSCCGWLFNGSGDFNNDGNHDVIIRNTQSGQWYIYNLSAGNIISRGYVPIESAIYIGVQAVADFNNDGYADVLLRNENTGEWNMTLMNNRVILEEYVPPMSQVLTWKVVDAKDFDGNGSADILIRNKTSGAWYIYLYNNTDIISRGYVTTVLPENLNEEYQGVADFDGDGMNDLLFRNLSTNKWSIAFMNGRTPISLDSLEIESSADWEFNSTNDYNGDGKADISLRNRSSENVSVFLLNGLTVLSQSETGSSLRNDTSAQSLISLTAPNKEATTTQSAQEYYNENISASMVQGKCIACHTSSGVAATSRLHFVNSNETNYQTTNHQTFVDFVGSVSGGADLVLSKMSGTAHSGGTQVPSGSADYEAMSTYLNMLGN